MILGLQIGLLIAGFLGLVRGRLTLTKSFAVEGGAARLAGAAWCLPFPVAFGVGFVAGVATAVRGKQFDVQAFRWPMAAAEGGVTLSCLALGAMLAVALARPPEPPERRARPLRRGDQPLWVEDIEESDAEEDFDAPRRARRAPGRAGGGGRTAALVLLALLLVAGMALTGYGVSLIAGVVRAPGGQRI